MGERKIHKSFKFARVNLSVYDNLSEKIVTITKNYRFINDKQLKKEIEEDLSATNKVLLKYKVDYIFRNKYEMSENKFIQEAKVIIEE